LRVGTPFWKPHATGSCSCACGAASNTRQHILCIACSPSLARASLRNVRVADAGVLRTLLTSKQTKMRRTKAMYMLAAMRCVKHTMFKTKHTVPTCVSAALQSAMLQQSVPRHHLVADCDTRLQPARACVHLDTTCAPRCTPCHMACRCGVHVVARCTHALLDSK
jgi:hypothetical protein